MEERGGGNKPEAIPPVRPTTTEEQEVSSRSNETLERLTEHEMMEGEQAKDFIVFLGFNLPLSSLRFSKSNTRSIS